MLTGYGFLSLRPLLRVINAGDDDDESMYANLIDDETLFLRGRLEAELALMALEEAAEFLTEFGIAEQGLNRAIRRCYALLGLISFFTIGDDEVRAWAVAAGSKAPAAAGIIHTDMQKGFIRAETIHFDDLMNAGKYGRGAQPRSAAVGRQGIRCPRRRHPEHSLSGIGE